MCVFVGYLLPGMVQSGWTRVWSDIGGLVLAVILHMVLELYFVWKFKKVSPGPSDQNESYWFLASGTTLFISCVLLLVLLTCAVLAGKTIRKITSQKVPSALSCCNSHEKRGCDNIGDHVLKCWIVVRASQPDYIMARSVFSSFAGFLVTVSVLTFIVKWKCIHLPRHDYDMVHKITVAIEFAFVLVGWIVIFFRWVIAVMYFPRNPYFLFHLEDFWTRSLVEVKEDLDRHLKGRLYRLKRIRERTFWESVMVNFITVGRLHSLLFPMRIWLQKFMVALSKASWSLSEIVIGLIRPFIMSRESYALLCGLPILPQETGHFSIYKDALDCIRMPGEIAYSLWIANQPAFKEAENHMKQGIERGKDNTSDLMKILTEKTWSVEGEAVALSLAVDEEKYYQDFGKKSWKMRAVSLIYCMIHVCEFRTNCDVIDEAMKVYCQAWDFIDFVDSSNPEANLVSLAADKEFDTLQHIWNKKVETLVEGKIRPLTQEMRQLSKQGTPPIIERHDSEEWMSAALKYNLYKTWKAVDANSNIAIHDLRCLFGNVIVHCIKNELDKALIENCSKWAKDGREEEIYRATFIAGKAKGMREKVSVMDGLLLGV